MVPQTLRLGSLEIYDRQHQITCRVNPSIIIGPRITDDNADHCSPRLLSLEDLPKAWVRRGSGLRLVVSLRKFLRDGDPQRSHLRTGSQDWTEIAKIICAADIWTQLSLQASVQPQGSDGIEPELDGFTILLQHDRQFDNDVRKAGAGKICYAVSPADVMPPPLVPILELVQVRLDLEISGADEGVLYHKRKRGNEEPAVGRQLKQPSFCNGSTSSELQPDSAAVFHFEAFGVRKGPSQSSVDSGYASMIASQYREQTVSANRKLNPQDNMYPEGLCHTNDFEFESDGSSSDVDLFEQREAERAGIQLLNECQRVANSSLDAYGPLISRLGPGNPFTQSYQSPGRSRDYANDDESESKLVVSDDQFLGDHSLHYSKLDIAVDRPDEETHAKLARCGGPSSTMSMVNPTLKLVDAAIRLMMHEGSNHLGHGLINKSKSFPSQHRLGSLVPALFSPGYSRAISHCTPLLRVISHVYSHHLFTNARSRSLKDKLSLLSSEYHFSSRQPYDAASTRDRGESFVIKLCIDQQAASRKRSKLVTAALWRLIQRCCFQNDASRRLKPIFPRKHYDKAKLDGNVQETLPMEQVGKEPALSIAESEICLPDVVSCERLDNPWIDDPRSSFAVNVIDELSDTLLFSSDDQASESRERIIPAPFAHVQRDCNDSGQIRSFGDEQVLTSIYPENHLPQCESRFEDYCLSDDMDMDIFGDLDNDFDLSDDLLNDDDEEIIFM